MTEAIHALRRRVEGLDDEDAEPFMERFHILVCDGRAMITLKGAPLRAEPSWPLLVLMADVERAGREF